MYVKILYALPVYQSVILAFLLFLSNRNQQGYSRFIMGIFQLLIAFYYAFNFMYSIKAFNVVAEIYLLILPVILAFVPVFYMYMLSITTTGFRLRKKQFWHFTPSFLILLLNLPFLFTTGTERILYISYGYSEATNDPLLKYIFVVYILVIYGICNLQLAVYFFKAMKLYRKHKAYIENHYSYTENINLKWILALIVCFVSFFVINDILYIIGFRQHFIAQFIYNASMLGISLFAGYHGLVQKDLSKGADVFRLIQDAEPTDEPMASISNGVQADPIESKGNESTKLGEIYTAIKTEILPVDTGRLPSAEKYSGSTLTEDQRQVLIGKLEMLMFVEKIFIKDNLTVEEVSRRLGTKTKYVSQIINENYQKNFYNYINTYRVEEAMKLLVAKENEKYSILGIAQIVGFVSKSPFNAAFKKVAGVTPSEYRNKFPV
ncbi:MAG: helix-turn-helix domain-containing protein [Bacteroidales bacterium]